MEQPAPGGASFDDDGGASSTAGASTFEWIASSAGGGAGADDDALVKDGSDDHVPATGGASSAVGSDGHVPATGGASSAARSAAGWIPVPTYKTQDAGPTTEAQLDLPGIRALNIVTERLRTVPEEPFPTRTPPG